MVQSNLSKKLLRGKSQFDLSKSAENVIDKKKDENWRKREKENFVFELTNYASGRYQVVKKFNCH